MKNEIGFSDIIIVLDDGEVDWLCGKAPASAVDSMDVASSKAVNGAKLSVDIFLFVTKLVYRVQGTGRD
jgi:hypothetical protein